MCAAAAKGDNERLFTLMEKVCTCMHTLDTASKVGMEAKDISVLKGNHWQLYKQYLLSAAHNCMPT